MPSGLFEDENKEHAENISGMSSKANQRFERYKKERRFRELLKELHYPEFAVHLYQKLENGKETDSAYMNDYYLFKRIS